jgi:cAMP-dependent protein kinase regulator
MKNRNSLSKKEQKDLEKKMALLEESPQDTMAASRAGYLLNKAGRTEEASSYLWTAFRGFIDAGQYSMAVMIADELLSIRADDVEILHRLSKLADREDIEIPVLELYRKYEGFHGLPLFSELDGMEFLQLLKASEYHDIRERRAVIREGARGDEVYLIVEGRVRVTKKAGKRKEILLGTLNQGDFLGEIAYMSDRRRTATITAETPCRLLSWKGESVGELNQRHPQVARVLFHAFWERSLHTVLSLAPLFSHLDGEGRRAVMEQFDTRYYQPEEEVLCEGEKNPEGTLYIVRKGEAAVLTREGKGSKHPVALLKAGDIFGEYSALLDMPCTATVTARTDLEVLTLTSSAFMKIVEDYPETARVLEEIGRERLDRTLLHMPYFRLIQEPGFA